MNDLDRELLLEVKAWAEKEIERIEIHRANAPLFAGFAGRARDTVTKRVPELTAGPHAAVRDSVLKLERSLRESDERQAQAEEGRQRRLAQAQARTAALREWLEALA